MAATTSNSLYDRKGAFGQNGHGYMGTSMAAFMNRSDARAVHGVQGSASTTTASIPDSYADSNCKNAALADQAQALKDLGDQRFHCGQFHAAINKYDEAVTVMGHLGDTATTTTITTNTATAAAAAAAAGGAGAGAGAALALVGVDEGTAAVGGAGVVVAETGDGGGAETPYLVIPDDAPSTSIVTASSAFAQLDYQTRTRCRTLRRSLSLNTAACLNKAAKFRQAVQLCE